MENFNIVIDDGSVEVPIVNKLGEQIGVFRFNPTDVGIVTRYNEVAKRFSEIINPLSEIGNGNDEEDKKIFEEAKKNLFEACDYLFGGNMSEAFFGKINPFSPVNGVFYCEHALSAVGDYISNAFDVETKKIEKRIEKYTKDYLKKGGEHR